MKIKAFGCMFLVIALVLCMVATVSAGVTYNTDTVMLSMEKTQSTSTVHRTGEDAADFVDYSATYYSKTHSGAYATTLKQIEYYVKHEIEEPEKEKGEYENTFIDGTRGNILDVDCEVSSEEGYGSLDLREDVTTTCTYAAEWNLEDKNEHAYSRVGLDDNDAISFTVPEGWKLAQ